MDYNKKCEEILNQIQGKKKRLLLHACCAPCSSSVLERLIPYFDITILFYNPNITDIGEYEKRKKEIESLIKKIKAPISLLPISYEDKLFFEKTKGMEKLKEGDIRCYTCYEMRLEKTAEMARKYKFDFFTTTLSISPYKNALWINEIGEKLEKKYKTSYLYADFKKKNGYQRSILLSKKYQLYRQNYCGCIYSKRDRIEKGKKFNKSKLDF